MRILVALVALVALAMSLSAAEQPAFRAGMLRLAVQDAVPFDTLVTYPTLADDQAVQAGPFKILARPNAPIAAETRFPVVLFSHGNGRRGGSPLIHRDIIFALARHGFVVVAPSHPGTERPLADRPRQVRLALERVAADKRLEHAIDRDRLGMIGFSFGGAVTLIAGGATPSLRHLSAYCGQRINDPRACDGVPADIPADAQDLARSPDILPLKAMVLLEPFGALFDQQGLRAIRSPVLLHRAEQSDLKPEGNIFALAKALPLPPRQASVPGGHFVFVGACPPELEASEPVVCRDAPGIDRTAIQERIQAEVLSFLRLHLR